MIFLQKNGIIFVLFKVHYGLQIFLVKIFLLKLFQHDITLFGLTETSQEYVQVVLHLFYLLGVDFRSYAFYIVYLTTAEGFQELPIVLLGPIVKSLTQQISILFFELLRNFFKIILHFVDFHRYFCNSVEIWIKLKLKMFSLNTNGCILLRFSYKWRININWVLIIFSALLQ